MKKNFVSFLISTILSIFFLSCSLSYEKEESPESKTPEFTFSNVNFTRTENDKITMKMNAQTLEQYKSDSFSFAKNTNFNTFDKDGNNETKGECELLSADMNNEHYILFGNINLNLISQEMEIFAESLNFDKKNEQITSGNTQKVRIKNKDTDVSGTGFRASGISKRFSFTKEVSGTIESNSEE